MWKLDKGHDDGSLITSLGLRELFIGHDVGHPGFTNVFEPELSKNSSLVFVR